MATLLSVLSVVAVFGGLVFAGMASATNNDGLVWPLILAGIASPFLVRYLYVRRRVLRARKVDDQVITLVGVAPPAIEAILAAASAAPPR